MSEHENGRPGKGGHMSSTTIKAPVLSVGASADVPRCDACGHVIYSRESIESGLGRDCRRRRGRAVV